MTEVDIQRFSEDQLSEPEFNKLLPDINYVEPKHPVIEAADKLFGKCAGWQNTKDFIFIENRIYENISFDPRIRYCLDRINNAISEVGYLDIECVNGKTNIVGLSNIISKLNYGTSIQITDSAIKISFSGDMTSRYVEIAIDLQFTDKYLKICRCHIVQENNNVPIRNYEEHIYYKEHLYDNEFFDMIYGFDNTLKLAAYHYFVGDTNPWKSTLNNSYWISTCHIFSPSSSGDVFLEAKSIFVNGLCDVDYYYYSPYKLSLNNLLLLYSFEKEPSISKNKTILTAYAKYGQSEMRMNDNLSDPKIARKQVQNYIFDSFDMYKFKDNYRKINTPNYNSIYIPTVYRAYNFTLREYSGVSYSDGYLSRTTIKNNNHIFIVYVKQIADNNFYRELIRIKIYSPVTHNLVIDILCEKYFENHFQDLDFLTDRTVSNLVFREEITKSHIIRRENDVVDCVDCFNVNILTNNLSKYFSEFINNPFIILSNRNDIDDELIIELLDCDKNVFKKPFRCARECHEIGLEADRKENELILSSHTENGMRIDFIQEPENKPWMHTCGSTFSRTTVKKTVVDEKTGLLQSSHKMVIDKKTGKVIDESKADYSIMSKYFKDKYNKNGYIGYKACIGPHNEKCIVKLYVPPDAYIATDSTAKKFRTNKCRVLDIATLTNNFAIKEDFRNNICSRCAIKPANKVASPCMHMYCTDCIYSMIDTKCSVCKKSVISVGNPIIEYNSEKKKQCQLTVAYSFITSKTQRYKIGDEIIVDNYDKSLEHKCSSGIHFHLDMSETYQWFEYMNIPNELRPTLFDTMNLAEITGRKPRGQAQVSDTLNSDAMKLHTKLKHTKSPTAKFMDDEIAEDTYEQVTDKSLAAKFMDKEIENDDIRIEDEGIRIDDDVRIEDNIIEEPRSLAAKFMDQELDDVI